MSKKLLIVLGVIVLVGFLSLATGFASISSIQEQLKSTKLKLVGEQIKLLQEKILGVGKEKPVPVKVEAEPVKSKEELSKSLENQIKQLEEVVRVLNPRAMDEEVLRLEKKIGEISKEIATAEGGRLQELEKEFGKAVEDYNRVSSYIKKALEENIKAKQVETLRGQIWILQDKVKSLPPVQLASVPALVVSKEDDTAKKASLRLLQDQIQAVRTKILAEQVKAIQGQINKLKAK